MARTGSLYWLGMITSHRIGDPIDKLILLAMADHIDQDDSTIASIGLLADEAEVSERTARTHLAAMEERGWITRVRTRRGQRQGVYITTLRRAPFEALPAARREHPEPADGAGRERPSSGTQAAATEPVSSGTSTGISSGSPRCRAEPPNVEPPNVEPPNTRSDLENASAAPSLALVVADDHPPDYRFEDFWQSYPMRNGVRVGKAKALEQWRRLPYPDKAAAFRGVKHYREHCDAGLSLAKDAMRWLRDRCWTDWQEQPGAPSATTARDRRIIGAGLGDAFLEAAGATTTAPPREITA